MYICHKLEKVWHWCRNCPEYPKGNYVVNRATPPPQGQGEELCPTCAELAKTGRCDGD